MKRGLIPILKFFDGAFGTYYFEKTGDYSPCELANLTNGEAVVSIHREYIKAGADAIKTNTFGANPAAYGDGKLREIITRGYKLAKQAADGTSVSVFADIGNISVKNAADYDVESLYMRVADIFISLGASDFLFETLSEFDAIKPALSSIKAKVKDARVLVSFAVSQEGFSRKGMHYKTLINEAAQNPDVDIIGLNCVCGPAHLFNLAKELGKISKPLSIMPNSGYPATINGRTVFQDNAEYFAGKLAEINSLGVDILGGCCGTTPKHIELSVKAIEEKDKQAHRPAAKQAKTVDKNTKRLKLKEILVELDPPLDDDCGFILSAVDKLADCGVTAITLADSPLAKARADSVLTAVKVKQEKNIDVLPHITCRDKNHIAIKGVLLGASFFGINKILAVTGDPIYDANRKKSGVFSFNSQQLISYINSLNNSIFSENPFSIGGALNVNAPNFDAELERARKKIENGADFLLSQPIFTNAAAENFIKARERLDRKLYAGILPVASYKNAIFLNNEVSGIEIPQDVIDGLKDKGAEEVYDISIGFAKGIINRVYDSADGFYIMTPLKKTDLVCELIKRCFDA